MSTLQIEGLWQFIQTMSLSNRNKQWLAQRLLESSRATTASQHSETDYIMSSPEMMNVIDEGDKQIKSGKFTTTPVDSIWNL